MPPTLNIFGAYVTVRISAHCSVTCGGEVTKIFFHRNDDEIFPKITRYLILMCLRIFFFSRKCIENRRNVV